jgi:MOSC domain-containing protein YiiM
MIELDAVEARLEAGLTGDHARPGVRNARQVTLIQFEHLAVISALMGRPEDQPVCLKTCGAIWLSAVSICLASRAALRIGQAIFETTGWCQPCARLQNNLGPGTFQAVRGHGGITARVLQSGSFASTTVSVEPVPDSGYAAFNVR